MEDEGGGVRNLYEFVRNSGKEKMESLSVKKIERVVLEIIEELF